MERINSSIVSTNFQFSFYMNLTNLTLDLLLEQLLQSNRISSELGNTLPELLGSHSILVQLETEQSLILEIATLGNILTSGVGGVELLGDGGGGVVELLEEVGL